MTKWNQVTLISLSSYKICQPVFYLCHLCPIPNCCKRDNFGNLGDLADGVSSQSGTGDILQFTSTDGRDEVQVVWLVQLVPQVLHTHTQMHEHTIIDL